ncbi:MAG: FAD-binding oxidoreductase [Thermoguttaceae bacterium]|nr:FAD-binding oxidoreductase [Thermoguttaceae bacterium]
MTFQDPKIASFHRAISSFIPPKRLFTDELKTLAWGADASFYRQIPQIVVFPKDEAEVSKILKAASELGVPLTFRASGTSLSGQASTKSVLVVVGQYWEKCEVLDGGERVALQPGVLGGRVNEVLAKFGRKFPPDPASVKAARVGGIVSNNASGMNCGVHANSERVMESARLIFADGTILDVADPKSREEFAKKKPDFIKRIEEIRDSVRADSELAALIEKKYRIKNVTGLNLRPLIAYDDPFEIVARLLVGAEGTLAFLSETTMRTEKIPARRATAMIYTETLREACQAIQILKKEPVISAEILDRKALRSVENMPAVPTFIKDLGPDASAALLETAAESEEELRGNVEAIQKALADFPLLYPVEFTEDPKIYSAWWSMRSGVFPIVGGEREIGTTALIEDVAFPIDVFPEATVELQKIIDKYGYKDGVIYGHALEGNFHFVLNQRFDSQEEIDRYKGLMLEVVELVVDKYDGSLKAEHGTGRNMAPFVEREWGPKAFAVMKELKRLFDPNNILNPGVIFNDDPECYIKDFKPLPQTSPLVDKCIECGFCEPNCLTCGFSLSSRQRVVVRREISRLERDGSDPRRLADLKRAYKVPGEATCAGDGLCSTSCPMGINVGELTHVLRGQNFPEGSLGRKLAGFSARKLSLFKSGLRPVLGLARVGRLVLGRKGTTLAGKCLRKFGFPLWTPSLPKPFKIKKSRLPNAIFAERNGASPASANRDKVVYFPSCINQTMGASEREKPLVETTVALLEKAGYEVVFPPSYENLCCGTIWESIGFPELADAKTKELEDALWLASDEGKYPVLCDQSPCLHRMREKITRLQLFEPAEFIEKFLVDRLEFRPVDEPIAVHITCTMRKMNLGKTLINLAKRCSTNVLVPEEIGCCGFAGDKGFTRPEVNAFALRKLEPQIEKNKVVAGYSNSRTCEIGLSTNGGVPYSSIVYLVDRCTVSKR